MAPDSEGNAVTRAQTPNFLRLLKDYPTMTVFASGNEVGLLFGEMGNSEVGHLNIGAGRVYYQTCPRINKEITDGTFFTNPAFLQAIEQVKKNKSKLHLIGLVSPGNVHSSNDHLYALLKLCAQNKLSDNVFVHAILDGRDCIYNSGKDFIAELQNKMKEIKAGKIASMSGRYYALDRDNRWDRCEKAYSAMADGKADRYGDDPIKIIEDSYAQQNYDEEFVPAVITKGGKPVATIQSKDAAIFFNFRPDRARQLTQAFVLPGFNKFPKEYIKDLFFVTLTEFEKDLPAVAAYPPVVVHNCLAEIISKAGLKQFHIAETEKYAHVTFFLNGTIEEPFPLEDRFLVPSPKVSSYAQKPEMSAYEVLKELNKAIDSDKYDFIVVNYANPDMVGHTGIFEAAVKAVETVDECVGRVVEEILQKGGAVLLTADHGNAEKMLDVRTGQPHTAHTTNPVPFSLIINDNLKYNLREDGILADVAPTALELLKIKKPAAMTGKSLIQ